MKEKKDLEKYLTLIGIDFSITKPAVCIKYFDKDLSKFKYIFYGYPRPDSISKSRIDLYRNNGVEIFDRDDEKNPHTNSSEKMAFSVWNSQYLADLITKSLSWIFNSSRGDDIKIAFEGLSFASSGDAVLQLGGYKYILMDRLSTFVPLENMYTYAPISIKKTAGCSKKGMTKKDMIESFLFENIEFSRAVKGNPNFYKKGAKNHIELLDDLVDAYWTVRTYEEKNPI